ncbi:MAG: acylneuraminate cytidylyltransferase family protein [Candidatus Promineifilaceae bacterium]
MAKTLCFIPARGGSKRIPRKNLRPLAGKPLLSYTIETAKESAVFDEIVVSSDDDEILNLAQSVGTIADHRPASLSGDMIRFVQVVEEYLQRPGVRERFTNIAAMLPTCPFRTTADMVGAFNLFREQKGESFVISVTEYDFPPQLALDIDEDSILTMRDPATYGRTTRSQSLGKAYHPNGAIYLATVSSFLREKTFFADPLLGYPMTAENSFDIDYPYQFRIAEILMQERLLQEQE